MKWSISVAHILIVPACCACSHLCSVCLSCFCVPIAENVPAHCASSCRKVVCFTRWFPPAAYAGRSFKKAERKVSGLDQERTSWAAWFLSSAAHFVAQICTSFSARTSICWCGLQGLIAHGNHHLRAGGGGNPFSLLVEIVVVLLSPQKYQAWSSSWDCLELSMINSLLLVARWKMLIPSVPPPVVHGISAICVQLYYTKLLCWIVNTMWMFCRSPRVNVCCPANLQRKMIRHKKEDVYSQKFIAYLY